MTPEHASTERIPVDGLNANLRKLGRRLDNAQVLAHRWDGEEYGLHLIWRDGFTTFVGFGLEASAQLATLAAAR